MAGRRRATHPLPGRSPGVGVADWDLSVDGDVPNSAGVPFDEGTARIAAAALAGCYGLLDADPG